MNLFKWIFPKETKVISRGDYHQVNVSEISPGDEVKGWGTVTDRYKVLGDWRVWCGDKTYLVDKNTMVWVKQ